MSGDLTGLCLYMNRNKVLGKFTESSYYQTLCLFLTTTPRNFQSNCKCLNSFFEDYWDQFIKNLKL